MDGVKYQFEYQAIEWYCLLALHEHISNTYKGDDKIVLQALTRNRYREFTKQFYNAVLDYLTSIVYGEARHAKGYCPYHIPCIEPAYSRQQQYVRAKEYDPIKSLPKIVELYSHSWKGGFGGSSWKKIAAHALSMWEILYQDIDEAAKLDKMAVELDVAVSIAHNGGLAYDKPTIFTCNKYEMMTFLDYRQSCPDYIDLIEYISKHYFLTEDTWKIVAMLKGQQYEVFMFHQAKTGTLRIQDEALFPSVSNYNRIAWGQKELESPISKYETTETHDYSPSIKPNWYGEASYPELYDEFIVYPTNRKEGVS